MYNLCKVNEPKLLVDQPTERQTDSSKVMCPPFFERGYNNVCRTIKLIGLPIYQESKLLTHLIQKI